VQIDEQYDQLFITSDASMAANNYITRITDWCILGDSRDSRAEYVK